MPVPVPAAGFGRRAARRAVGTALVAGAVLTGLLATPVSADVPSPAAPGPQDKTAHDTAPASKAPHDKAPHDKGPQGDGPHDGPHDKGLQRALADLVAAPGGPPGVIAVLTRDGDRRVYRAGTAELGTGRPPRTGDHMRIASAAKAFSGAVALSLVDRRALALDDTIGRRLPHLPAAWHKVTLRQLLQHTSGLPDFSLSQAFQDIVRADPRHHFDSRRLLDFVADQDLAFKPGSRYGYSNSDNIAVALMSEQATGRPYESLLRELVYRPLGLHRTSLPQGYRLPRPYLHGYDTTPGEAPEDVSEAISASGAWASGGIVSTPRDLSTFIGGYAGPTLLSPATRRAQQDFLPGGASEPAGPGSNAAGLALFRYTTRCGTVFGHTGNTPGYTQFAAATRDGRRTITVSVTSQVTLDPALLARLRATEEKFVCALLDDGHR
ncbi:serine hydrolase [Streptomyces sp. SKN60]|uniref:serine hydrolase domain-containing protein n=1 Tax=Streptomyces sp. SKN60 TaxID=2855506 RepID=UPI002247EEDA|nr:serine hydrolase domain-containing protein [Streptomyces sp. SKN60]